MKITTSNSRKLIFSGIFTALSGTIALVGSDLSADIVIKALLFKIGLTLIVLGFLLTVIGTGFYFLAKKGSNVFAVNLVFFYLGLSIIVAPIFLQVFEITITDPIITVMLIGSGIILALLGFFGEYAQLNQWFLVKIQLISKQLVILKNKINWRLVFHPANVLTLISAGLVALWINEIVSFEWWITLASVMTLEILNAVLVFPEIPRMIRLSISTFFAVLAKGLKWSLLHLDEFVRWMMEWVRKSFRRVIVVVTFIFQERGLIFGGLGVATVALLGPYLTTSQILVAAFSVLMTSILLLALQHPLLGRSIITESRATAFKVKTRIQIRRIPRALVTCYQCSIQLKKPYPKECPNCSAPQYFCMICNGLIEPSVLVVCPHCEYPAHSDHLIQWLQIKPKCPHCRQPLHTEGIKRLELPRPQGQEVISSMST